VIDRSRIVGEWQSMRSYYQQCIFIDLACVSTRNRNIDTLFELVDVKSTSEKKNSSSALLFFDGVLVDDLIQSIQFESIPSRIRRHHLCTC